MKTKAPADETKELRRLMRMYFAEADLTASGFANAIGVSPAYISKVMNGGTRPSRKILDAIGCEYRLVKKCL
jgi:transcriptional regulator with XRE-family HTH domain